MKKFVYFFIATRTLVAAFYDVNLFGPIRVTDATGVLFPLVALFFLSRLTSSGKATGKSIVLVPLIWLFISSIWIIVLHGQLGYVYIYAKQIIRFANGVVAFVLFAKLFTTYDDITMFAKAVLISTVFPMLQILLIAIAGPTVLGFNAMELDDHTLVSGVYGNYGVFATSTYLGMIALLLLWRGDTDDARMHKYYTIGFIIYIMAGMITVSRILLGQMLSVTSIFLYSLKRKGNFGVILLFVATFIVVSNTAYFETQTDTLLNRSEYEFDVLRGDKGREYAMHGRVERWETVLEIFLNDYQITDQIIGTDLYIGPHGDYFYWLVSYGWIGLILYLRLNYHIINVAIRSWIKYKKSSYRMFGAAMLSAAAIYVISAIGTTPSFMPDTLYLVFGMMGIALNTNFLKSEKNAV